MAEDDPVWVRESSGVPSLSQLRFLPHELEFRDANQRVMRTLRDLYQEIAMAVDRRGETKARHAHSFDAPTFLQLPSGTAEDV
jgi:hypothetical protein